MTRRTASLAVAIVLYGAAAALPADAARAPWHELLRDLSRPFVLPPVWQHLSDAAERNDPAEALAAGRVLAALLPDWTDGLVHVAWIEALDLATEDPDEAARADRLAIAVGWLDEQAEQRLARTPQAAVSLWLAASTLIDARCSAEPELALAFTERRGLDPRTASHRLVERAAAVAQDPAIRARRAFSTLRLTATAIRLGELGRAATILAAARAQLAALDGDDLAPSIVAAIDRMLPLAEYPGDPNALAALATNPWLEELAAALAELHGD